MCYIGLYCCNAVNCLHSLQVCLYSSVLHHNWDYFLGKIQSHPSQLMSVLRDTPQWIWLIRDLCSGRGFCCCKLAFYALAFKLSIVLPRLPSFLPLHQKPTFVSIRQNQFGEYWALNSMWVLGGEELGQRILFTLSEPCVFMYLTLNRCNWLTPILSSTSTLSYQEWEDNVLVQMGPPLGINDKSTLSLF